VWYILVQLSSLIEKIPSTKILKSQNTNIKWFDKLTTLSQVEGQITMTEIQNIKQCFDLLVKSLPSCHCERSEAISINLCL
jgi:hypothetical protein